MADELVQTLVETGLVTSNAKSPPRVYLCRVTTGPSVGSQVSIGARPIVVGTHAQCDLIVEDPKVSRRHVKIWAEPGGIHVEDLESRNGTYTTAGRVYDAVQQIGDAGAATIHLGDTTLRIQSAPSPAVAPSKRERFGGLVGTSLLMRELFGVLELAAPTDATILLQGESGTGKEITAEAIHDHSRRADGPFVVFDGSATNPSLIDSQLFGHVKGAFTGAVTNRNGAFVEADGGTLFLDEVGELPLESQAKLLRALESGTVQPVGSDRTVSIDTRVVAATHRDLGAMVDDGTFRFDVFHRLSVVHVAIPPLRERLEDLPLLIRALYRARGIDPGPIEGTPLERLSNHPWPGNVRELRNVLERSLVLAGDAPFSELSLWLGASAPAASGAEPVELSLPFKDAKQRVVDDFERRYLAALMQRYDDNLSAAANHAEINRGHLRKLLEAHGLRSS